MNIQELIEKLKKIEEEVGNVSVELQFDDRFYDVNDPYISHVDLERSDEIQRVYICTIPAEY